MFWTVLGFMSPLDSNVLMSALSMWFICLLCPFGSYVCLVHVVLMSALSMWLCCLPCTCGSYVCPVHVVLMSALSMWLWCLPCPMSMWFLCVPCPWGSYVCSVQCVHVVVMSALSIETSQLRIGQSLYKSNLRRKWSLETEITAIKAYSQQWIPVLLNVGSEFPTTIVETSQLRMSVLGPWTAR